MKSPITKLAAAAFIIIAVLIGIHQFGGSINTVALADVIEAMLNAEWVHYHFVIDVTGVDEKIAKKTSKGWEGWQSVNPLRRIEKHNNGKIYFTEENKGKTSRYDPQTNTITIIEYKPPSTSQQGYTVLADMYIEQIAEVEKQGGKVKYEEGVYEGSPVKIISIDFTSGGGKRTKMSIIVDPETHLPKIVTAQQWFKGQYLGLISGTFDYPDDSPGDIYALGVPRTAKIIDTRDIAAKKATDESKQRTSDNDASKLVALDIKLPRPMFIGTPQDARMPNLEKPLGRPRDPFLAPVGTKNVALGKPVSSSDQEPIIGEIKMITDGDKEATDGSYVELGPLLQHITIDLQAVYEIYAIVVWHYHKQARVYFDVVAQVADDPDFITNVGTLFNNDIDNTSGLGVGQHKHYVETNEGKLIDAKGVRARYVRLYSKGNSSDDLNHYIEVEVYGKPAGR